MARRSGWHRKSITAAARARAQQYASAEHRQLRKQGQAEIDAGRGYCWRCRRHLPRGSRWHLGHDDNDRTIYRGIECPTCNVKAAASKGARVANARRQRAVSVRRRNLLG